MSWMDELRRLLGQAHADEPDDGLTCREAHERVIGWLDGEIDPLERSGVGEHLLQYARCYPVLRFERAFHGALPRLPQNFERAPAALHPKELG